MRYQFKPASKARFEEVACGNYYRRFVRAEEPFEVDAREARLLRGISNLEPVPDAPAPEDHPEQEDATQSEAEADAEETESAAEEAAAPVDWTEEF